VLFMREGGAMRLKAESGCTPEIIAFLHAHPIRAGRETFTGRVMLSGEPVHIPAWISSILRRGAVRSGR